MQEFKIGDKVLMEVEIVGENKGADAYQIKSKTGTSTFWVAKQIMRQLIDKDTNIPTKTYGDGLMEAWETAKWLAKNIDNEKFTIEELIDIFDTATLYGIFRYFSPQEAAARIDVLVDKYDKKPGDIVRINGTTVLGVVAAEIDGYEDRVYVICSDGSCGPKEKALLEKTGRTVDIAEFMSKIGEEPAP